MALAARTDQLNVAICVDRAQGYGSYVLKGISKYVQIYGPWTLSIDPGFFGDYKRGWVENWRGDGLLAYIEDRRLARAIREAGIPVVEIFGHRFDLELPQISPDGRLNGQVAAQHLLERKFQQFAFCGYLNHPWSEQRQAGFIETIQKAGFSPLVHLVQRRGATLAQAGDMQRQVNEWIAQLPRPIAIMACSDRHAQRVLAACRLANFSVPEEVAIMGSGNDEELCHLSNPPLTSVLYDTERIGYEAAQMLHQLILGNTKAKDLGTVFIPPMGVVARRSTDVMAIHDSLIANTVRFIRENACRGISVEQILSEFKISKSTLYRRFEAVMGRSPHDEILRVQLERARNLLSQTDFPIERIAEMSGFQNTEYLYVAFKREVGMTPREYRLR
jgi:LacI family transcriptional regulator